MLNELVDLTELENLFSSKTVRSFRSDMKREYKLALCGLFGEVLKFGQYKQGRFYQIVMSLAANPKSFRQMLKKIRAEDTLYGFYIRTEHYFYNIEDQKYLDSVISFFRDYILNYKRKNKRLYLVSDIQKVYDIKKLYSTQGIKLKDHHWMDINFSTPATLTVPEFFNYIDVINVWNEYISVANQLLKENDPIEVRKLNFRYSTCSRQFVITSITFFEAYLYYYFYNLKSKNDLSENHPVTKALNQDGYIQDKQIVRQVIFKLHQHIKEDKKIKQLFKNINEHIKIRDRFIHSSAFIEQSNNLSQLQPFIDLNMNDVIEIAQDCLDFVVRVDELLPEDEKILFWWERFESPNFKKKEYISPLNKHKEKV
ncbi:hypothetical protein BAMY_09655 [Bacillus amyloliquefaciens]|uniref:hypothetical protein n=1 Tax=Bacillus TaxID=1386 RepID=UPI0005E14811|nr:MULTISPECIES: hypothetical protein [Bacillus amyloliquefaciens group]COD43111.1 Uncharacterised protein [Streptococcus pneumoniae]APB82404.1 hypothetical protein BAMY_09655 [Bacillus amyloliquefaciens]AZI47256.1 hypothetical protein BVMH_10240 [Bacillus velezensis]MEC1896588.1 hypothetical protein [Bacillus velezensis]MEC1905523.1 hypothetical protein [Bacillus velezensis]